MLLLLKNNFKQHLPFVLTAILMVGLIFSRAVLSITSIGLAMVAIMQWRKLIPYKKLFLGIALILLPVLISGLWSTNTTAWWRSVEVKLSLVTIAAGMLAAQFSFKQIQQLVWWLTMVIAASVLYSLYQYFLNEEEILNNYLVAKVMPVLMDDDHIRYSWLIVLNIILLVRVVFFKVECKAELVQADFKNTFRQAHPLAIRFNKQQKVKVEQWIAAIFILFFIAYLHFLAAKTGLLCLYVSLAITTLYLIVKVKWWLGILLIALITTFAFIAYTNLPSLKNRVQYVLYDFSNYSKGIYTEGSSDGGRILSLKAGIDITKENLLRGVGFGDVQAAIIQWHDCTHPSSKDYERFLPTNQWLIYSAGSGLLGVICFSVGLILLLQPLFSKNIFSFVLITVLLLPLVTDDSFEGQFGVSIVGLVVGLGVGFKRLKKEKGEAKRFESVKDIKRGRHWLGG
jgi:O-antigen ligase